jgi:glycerophosphoryl diester phosphodiesterase
VISLRRPRGFARVGHRGAAALAPENTLRAIACAFELGCDMVEIDVLDLADGSLVLAHSNDLAEVSHGAARGRVRPRSLPELRRVAPDLPTLDEALAFVSDRFPDRVVQIDLKLLGGEQAVADAVERHGFLERAWASSFDAASLRRLAEAEPELLRSFTYPRDRSGLSKHGPLAPAFRTGAALLRGSLPRRIPALLARARASALTLHHSVCTAAAVARAHELDVAVFVWTVDEVNLARTLVEQGVDGIITNDPRIFAALGT